MRRFTVVLGAALWCGVACGGGLPQPSQADAAVAAARWPGTTVANLGEGRSLYSKRCGTCHRLHEPAELREAEWKASMAEMRERAKVSPDEEALILKYLISVGSPRTAAAN